MTPIFLLEELTAFVKEKTSDIILPVRVSREGKEDKNRAANVYKMALPKKEDQTQKAPYILLQVLNGKDDQQPGAVSSATTVIRIVFVTYGDDAQEGECNLLNLISRVRSELEKKVLIANKFALQMPLEYIIYPDNTPPYFIGEMVTNWSCPTITREVEELWQ